MVTGPGVETKAKARRVLQGYKGPDLGEFEAAAKGRWRLVCFVTKSFGRMILHHELAIPLQLVTHKLLVLVKVAWYGLGNCPRQFFE
eukprot:117735-Amphidinium_carterae.4